MTESNENARLEIFCDGVFAIALTLLIIDIKLPASAEITGSHEFWEALRKIIPSIFAFLLSFIVILITWVNHHGFMRLIHKSSPAFLYANGFLLLTIVFVPFPTSLLGEHLFTDHAGPVVFLYNAVIATQGIAWILLTNAALKRNLARNEKSTEKMLISRRNSFYAFFIYALLAVLSLWFPLTMATLSTLTWIFWLVFGINIKQE